MDPDIDAVRLLLITSRTIQEIAKLSRASEKDVELKIFHADLTAYCAIIRDHVNRTSKTAPGLDNKLIVRILIQLESVVTPAVLGRRQSSACGLLVGTRLRALNHRWDEIRGQNDNCAKLDLIQLSMTFGTIPDDRNIFIQSLVACEDELRARYPEDPSQWTEDDFAPKKKIAEPSYAVWNAAQSTFKALMACKNCPCMPTHDFGARLCLGTYRKPKPGDDMDVDDDLDFDMFLSMKQDWHEVRVHTEKETVVQWAVSEEAGQSQKKKKASKIKPMRVKRLCEPIAKLRTMAAHRLELKVTRGQLFKLQSERSTSLIDQSKSPVSLEQFLKGGSRSFTERTRRILAVILSYAVLHLHDTPWLQPTWSSSSVFFFRTASSAIPLRPFIQTQLSGGAVASGHDDSQCGVSDDHTDDPNPGSDSDDFDPDDIDPDDLIGHQCPALVTLAVILMEIYFATPFDDLAKKYGIELGDATDSPNGRRYLDANLVFQACRGEIPENFQFHYAVEKCLDPRPWEDDDGEKLDTQILRTSIYEEVVRPLETELSQAYSSISIDDLDRFAQSLDVASWDQTIQTWSQQTQAHVPGEYDQGLRTAYSPSPRAASPNQPQYLSTLPVHSPQPTPFDLAQFLAAAPLMPRMATGTSNIDYNALRFFDDETVSEAHSHEACLSYANWKSKYQEVYDKFIPAQLAPSRLAPVKIAILDTGIDLTHPDMEARIENIKGKYNLLNDKFKHAVHDRNGHGTFTAGLILDFAPDAELYIARIADSKPSSPQIIAKVDIISMSFGFSTCAIEGYGEFESALVNAYANDVLLFAAASNSGGKLGRAFPAREPTVIAVHATDANGNRSRFSPTAATDDINLATVGEAVESAWPVQLCDETANPYSVKYKSGTSYATPIAAGIAGFLLLYARVHLSEKAAALKSQKRMKAVMKRLAEKGAGYKPRDGYHFLDVSLYADSLFGKDKALVDLTIRDLLSN